MFLNNKIIRTISPNFIRGHHDLTMIRRRHLTIKLLRTTRYQIFQPEAVNNNTSFNSLYGTTTCFRFKCNSVKGSLQTKNDGKQVKSSFQELMSTRKDQAQRSILMLVSTKEDIPFALAKCEQFGIVTNAFAYAGEADNYFLLIEFADEIATHEMFKTCQFQHTNDSFPVFSRIIQFVKKENISSPKVNIEVQEEIKTESSLKTDCSISEVIENIYTKEKLTELDTRLRHFFCTLVKDSASGIFPLCDVLPFGSSVNGIGRRGCDLDAMLTLYPNTDEESLQYQKNSDGELVFFNKTCIGQKSRQQKVVNFLGSYFHSFLPGITSVQKILHARVPIMKLNHRLLKMDCDVSVNNMSAIFMSDVVHFCGEVDSRFRPLLCTIKKWAKESGITHSTPGSWITNFGLTTLLIYFFQTKLLLPSFNDALVIVGEENSPGYHLQYLKSIDEWKNIAAQNKVPSAELLIEFFTFLAEYQFDLNIISLMTGKPRPHTQDVAPIWVQYPFDEDLNITKNVSEYEFSEIRKKAEIAAKSLEKHVLQKTQIRDFTSLLAISTVKRPKKEVDVNAYFELNSKHKAARIRRA